MTDETRNNGEKTGKPTPPVEHQFKPGNPGRQKGSRNKLGELFLEAMHADFETHGASVIEKVRLEKPDQYLKVVASILPKDLNVSFRKTDELSDDELIKRIRLLDASIQPFLAALGEDGTDQGDRAETAH